MYYIKTTNFVLYLYCKDVWGVIMIFKCKMCGGDVTPINGTNTGKCEYCKSVMTLPNLDDEKIINLYNRANDLRINNEFDKAYTVYENILNIDNNQVEAHWGLLLCKYGVEYVDDPKTKKKIPTCHRTIASSILTDSNYKFIKKESYGDTLKIYEEEATKINEIQMEILNISSKEKPYDIFICYKETDDNGERTQDSVIAQDIYDKLVETGYKVFFSRITLENKLGVQYEPYIYSALKSSKVMLVVGTKEEYFNAVWVKNEWSRYLEMMKTDKSKSLIPVFSKVDAYKLPEEFAMLQAQSMDKVGAMQDLVRGIKKLIEEYKMENVDGVDTETIAKVKAVLDEVRTVGNGKYEVTIVKENLPVWYYVITLLAIGIIGISYLFHLLMNVFIFYGSSSNIELITFAKNINMLPLILYFLSGVSVVFGLFLSIVKRKLYKLRNVSIVLSYIFLVLGILVISLYGYIPNIWSNDIFILYFFMLVPSFILLFVNPKWKLNVSNKSIMTEEEKNKQIIENEKIKNNFVTKEKQIKNIIFIIISSIIVVILLINTLNRNLSIFTKASNKENDTYNQVKVLSLKYIRKYPQEDTYIYVGHVTEGDIYNILDIVDKDRQRFIKIKTNTGITGYLLSGDDIEFKLNKSSDLYKKWFIQSNERNEFVKQLKVINDYINIRKSATIYSDIVGQVFKEEIYNVLDETDEDGKIWYKIETNQGVKGWIAGNYAGSQMVEILYEG